MMRGLLLTVFLTLGMAGAGRAEDSPLDPDQAALTRGCYQALQHFVVAVRNERPPPSTSYPAAQTVVSPDFLVVPIPQTTALRGLYLAEGDSVVSIELTDGSMARDVFFRIKYIGPSGRARFIERKGTRAWELAPNDALQASTSMPIASSGTESSYRLVPVTSAQFHTAVRTQILAALKDLQSNLNGRRARRPEASPTSTTILSTMIPVCQAIRDQPPGFAETCGKLTDPEVAEAAAKLAIELDFYAGPSGRGTASQASPAGKRPAKVRKQ